MQWLEQLAKSQAENHTLVIPDSCHDVRLSTRCGVLVSLYTDMTVNWDGTPCSLAEMNPRFGRACRFHLLQRIVSQPLPLAQSKPCLLPAFPYIG
jgi:hypothetical protein